MNDQSTARAARPTDSHGGLRWLALAAVAAGVLLLAAAAFVLSYAGIHAVALSAGVSPRLARIYPLIFDATLVVACAAGLSLRGDGLPSRIYAWLSMLLLLAAAAWADALHATGTRLPHRPAAAAAAIIPWALVLIGFGLLLCMLRQARLRWAAAAAAQPKAAPEPAGHAAGRRVPDSPPEPGAVSAERLSPHIPSQAGPTTSPDDRPAPHISGQTEPGPPTGVTAAPPSSGPTTPPSSGSAAPHISGQTEPGPPTGVTAAPPSSGPTTPPSSGSAAPPIADASPVLGSAEVLVPGAAETASDVDSDLAVEADPGQDDPVSDEARLPDQPEPARVLLARTEPPAGRYIGRSTTALSPAPTADFGTEATAEEPASEPEPAPRPLPAPHFDRMRSSPVPPQA